MSAGASEGRDPVPIESTPLDRTLPDPKLLDPTLLDPTRHDPTRHDPAPLDPTRHDPAPLDPTRWNEPMAPVNPGYAAYPAQYPPEYPDLGSGPSPAGYPPPAYQPYASYPPPAYQPYGGYPPRGYPATRPTSNFAIAALVLAFAFWPAGIAFGHVARRQIARTGESGRGLATAALVIGYLHFAFLALLIVVGVASSS